METGRQEQVGRLAGRLAKRIQVAGELLFGETIERLVLVERTDDVVSVAPGVLPLRIQLVAVRFRIANDVEPVLRPALAILRRSQQPLDNSIVGVDAASSLRKSATSRGVGGKPVRSKVSRRRSWTRPAAGAGARPAASKRASTKASTGVRTQAGLRTVGIEGCWRGRKDQCSLSFAVTGFSWKSGFVGSIPGATPWILRSPPANNRTRATGRGHIISFHWTTIWMVVLYLFGRIRQVGWRVPHLYYKVPLRLIEFSGNCNICAECSPLG